MSRPALALFLLVRVLLATMFFPQHSASGVFIDFLLTTGDPNHLTLECYSSDTGDVDNGANIFFFNSPSEGEDPHGNRLSGDTFDITPSNEQFLRCTSSDGTVQSDFVAIAGKYIPGV